MTQTTLFPVATGLQTAPSGGNLTKKELKSLQDTAWDEREIISLQRAALRECENDKLGVYVFVENQLPRTPKEALEWC
jgi:hypothetical protein